MEEEQQIVPENTGKIREKVGYRHPPKEHQFKPGNPGRPLGSKNFSTIFDEAISEIIKSKNLSIKDPEKDLMVKGIIEALKGNFLFWRSLAEWRYGKPKQPFVGEIDQHVIVQVIPEVAQRYNIYDNTETNTKTSDNTTGPPSV